MSKESPTLPPPSADPGDSVVDVVDKSEAAAKRAWERDVLEKLAFANLAEQRAARRWRIGFRLLWLLLVAALIWMSWDKGPGAVDASRPHTAVVTIEGEIAPGTPASAEAVVGALRNALRDSGSQAVVLLINSPGGSPVQAGIVYDEIVRLRTLHNKPIYAVVEESCTSAAYYIASAADKIYVDKASIVGSIGVLMDGFGFSGLMEKLGVERRLLTAGDHKGMLDPFSPENPMDRLHAQAMLQDIHEQLISAVKAGRKSRLKDQPEIFSGLFWTGKQAVELGLADQLGSLDYVAREVVKAEDLVDYTQRENVAERLAKRFGAALGEAGVKSLSQTGAVR